MAAGFVFDKTINDWRATTFKAEDQFVLTVEEIPGTFGDISASIKKVGGTYEDSCEAAYTETLNISGDGAFVCWGSFTQYEFNLMTLRYSGYYPFAYVQSLDTDSTLSVQAGTCTKID